MLAGLTTAALAARSIGLETVPPGLHIDEAHNGLDALRILEGARPIYLESNNGRDVLYSYLQAAFVGALGPTVGALRLTSGAVGALTVPLAYAFVRALPLASPRRTAALSAALLAGLLWHVQFSRIAIRGAMLPLVLTAGALALWKGIGDAGDRQPAGDADGADSTDGRGTRPRDGRSTVWLGVAGALVGASLYVHPAARLWPLVPLGFMAWRCAGPRLRGGSAGSGPRPPGLGLVGVAAFAGAAMAVTLPLAIYALRHPEIFLGHAAAVSVLDAEVGGDRPLTRVLTSAWRTARAIVWRGSDSWYHGLPGRPVFDPLVAASFLWGMLLLLRSAVLPDRWQCGGHDRSPRHRPVIERSAAVLILLWLTVMALPAVLTSGAPNLSRMIGLLPALCIPPALALSTLADRLQSRRPALMGRLRRAKGNSMREQARAARRVTEPVAPAHAKRWLPAMGTFGWMIAWLVVAQAAVLTARDYVGRYAGAAGPAETFAMPVVQQARAVAATAGDGGPPVVVSRLFRERSVLAFLTHQAPITSVDLTAGYVLPGGGRARIVLLEEEAAAVRKALGQHLPELAPAAEGGAAEEVGKPGTAALLSATLDPPRFLLAESPSGATFGGSIKLLGWSLAGGAQAVGTGQAGGPAEAESPQAAPSAWLHSSGDPIFVAWQALAPLQADLTQFLHVTDADGLGLAQHDTPPLAGSYPTLRWQPGDIVVQRFDPVLAPDAAGAGAEIGVVRVGWYWPADGSRLEVPGSPDGSVELGRLLLEATR